MGDRYGIDSDGAVSITPNVCCTTLLLCCLIFLCFTGCAGTENSKFYTLTYLAGASSGAPDPGSAGVSIGIGPVQLPEYLNRPQIVTRTGKYTLDIAEFDRWAAPLGADFSRVLAENLSILLSTDRIYIYPWNTSRRPDYQILIEIIQFDGDIPGDSNLLVRWSLLKDGQETQIILNKFHSQKPIAGQGYSGLATAMSLGILDLSREIAGMVLSERLGIATGED